MGSDEAVSIVMQSASSVCNSTLNSMLLNSSFTEDEHKLFSKVLDSCDVTDDIFLSLNIFKFMAYCYLRTVSPKGIEGILQGLDQILPSQNAVTIVVSSTCGAIIPPKAIAYKCLDCGADSSCVICADCFLQSPCVNHRFKLVSSGGGMCDCGDPEAWLPASFCKRHCAAHTAPSGCAAAAGDPRARRVFSAALALAFAPPHRQRNQYADLRGPDVLPALLSWALRKAEASPSYRDAIAAALCPAAPAPCDAPDLLTAALAAAIDPDHAGHAAAAHSVLLALMPVPSFKDAVARAFAVSYTRHLAAAPVAAASPADARRHELLGRLSVQLLPVPSIAAVIALAPAGRHGDSRFVSRGAVRWWETRRKRACSPIMQSSAHAARGCWAGLGWDRCA